MKNNCIIVASMGRAGSTALFASIAKTIGYSAKGQDFTKRLSDCKYKKGTVYKTHDFPPENPPDHAKFIWTFANPYEVVLSVINQENNEDFNIDQHFYNLRADYKFYHSIYCYDAMGLKDHFDSWYRKHNFNLLTVKYKSIWEREREISRFINASLDLPPFSARKERFPSIDKYKREMLIKTYGDLHNEVNQAENFKIWRGV